MPTLTLTDALEDAIAKAVAQGVPFETASLAAGLSRVAVSDWLRAVQHGTWSDGSPVADRSKARLLQFSERIARARAEWEQKQIEGIARAAQQHNEKTGVREWRASAWLLNNHPATRATYHELRETQSEVRTISPVYEAARALTDDELEQRLKQAGIDPTSGKALPEPASDTRTDGTP